MAFNLEIRLDRPDGIYLANEEISGVVTIHDPDGGRGTVQLVREWWAHGRGSGDFGSRIETTLATTWERGATELPFTLPMPSGPFTYRGQHTNLDWYVRAESGGVFSKVKAETGFIYGAIPNMPDVDFGPAYTVPIAPNTVGSSVTQHIRNLLIGIFGAIFAVVFLSSIAQLPPFFAVLAAAIFIAVVGLIVFMVIRNRLAQVKLGQVKLEIMPLELRPSDRVHLRFATLATADLTISSITVKLVQNEFYASGSGKNRSSATKAVLENVVEVSAQRFVRASEEIAFDLELPISEGAATTFMARDNAVTWQVSVTVAIAGWPDWQHLQAITVRP